MSVPQSDEPVDIIRIRKFGGLDDAPSLKREIIQCLVGNKTVRYIHEVGLPDIPWTKSLPSRVLYEGQGIDLYDAITRESQYYLYEEELNIIQKYGDDIAKIIVGIESLDIDLTLVDLGAGRMDKAACLVRSLVKLATEGVGGQNDMKLSATYCAIDLQFQELTQRLSALLRSNPMFFNGRHEVVPKDRVGKIALRGICGSYLECLSLLNDARLVKDTPVLISEGRHTVQKKCLLWLGSSLTNLHPADAVAHLQKFTGNDVLGPGDTILVGLDRCRDVSKVKSAYSESSQCWQAYMRNAVRSAGLILGGDAKSKLDESSSWEYVARWDSVNGKHMRFIRSNQTISFEIPPVDFTDTPTRLEIEKGEHVFICQSYKYTAQNIEKLFKKVPLNILQEWHNDSNGCSLYLLKK